jgi:1-acyl-sn-glycerol-3-phosphate acyltransferase
MNAYDLLQKTDPICSPGWTFAGRSFCELMFALPPRARVRLEGAENLPKKPSLFCPNHTHKLDFLPFRAALLRHNGMQLMTWVKARDFKAPLMRWVLGNGGSIPMVSRGYLIAADFHAVMGRKPTEAEYRQLRDHIDQGHPLDTTMIRLLGPRRIAGVAVDFWGGYRLALLSAYETLMGESLRHARRGQGLGRHQHIYPQGARSSQLTPGRIGAVQVAVALDLPIVPVGISGCREAFIGPVGPLTRGSEVVVRIGRPMSVQGVVPYGFRPFHWADEDRYRDPLTEATERVMEAINELCEPGYRWAPDLRSDAKQGIPRFYD